MRRSDAMWLLFVLFAAGISVYELRCHPLGNVPDSSFYFRK